MGQPGQADDAYLTTRAGTRARTAPITRVMPALRSFSPSA